MEIKHTFLFTLILGLAWTGLLFAFSTGPDPAMNGINGLTQTCAVSAWRKCFGFWTALRWLGARSTL
ncbi:MAG: hypothetical protein DMG15_27665 [Acidobacteria bacterium]|nr:MAG: hypothetical protein DMG15_27665 [Acidobacteriota bacterium]